MLIFTNKFDIAKHFSLSNISLFFFICCEAIMGIKSCYKNRMRLSSSMLLYIATPAVARALFSNSSLHFCKSKRLNV